jgi:hypothetical protein
MNVVTIDEPGERSRVCEFVLRDLPERFGIEEATAAYIHDVAEHATFAADDHRFLTLKIHTPKAAEVDVMCVRRTLVKAL